VRFVDRAAEAGLRYRWSIPGARPIDILQGIGNGCAFLDYDNDGRLDILLIGPQLALYRGDSHGHFTDVTQAAGLGTLSGHFLGCAVGDYDNDGFDDVYISGYRTGLLLHNERGKGYKDVTQAAGIITHPWETSCAWGDVDGDGRLDLYVCAYVDFDPPHTPRLCEGANGESHACEPQVYRPERGVLYHNEGRGRFRDVTRTWGADSAAGNALGVAFADYDDSRRQGFFVANDTRPQTLFKNSGIRVSDIGGRSGTAYADATPQAGMGVDWGDYDNDGKVDALVVDSEGAPLLLHNESRTTGHWLSLTLVGTKSNRDGYGARVTAQAGTLTQSRWCHTDGSYLSASDARVHLGLGAAATVDTLTIRWPSGHTDSLRHVKADQMLTVHEGAGAPGVLVKITSNGSGAGRQ